MQGVTGSYAFNGTKLSAQPSTANWVVRQELGRDGNNRPIYPAIRDYEMTWEIISTSDLKQLVDAQLSCVTGSIVSDLPKWGDTNYTYYSYTGTIINEPTVGAYFVEYVTGVKLVIGNVRTN